MNKAWWLVLLIGSLVAGVWLLDAPARDGAGAPAAELVPIGRMSVERAAHQATLLRSGEVLITGGCGGRGCESIHAFTEIYDPASRSFRAGAPMSTPRASHAAIRLADGRVLVCGGWDGRGPTASAELYDPAADRWMPAGDMTEARASPIAVALADGRILIVGGGGGRLGDLATAEIFDPATARFSAVGRMRTSHYLATRLADGRVLVTGGQGPEGEILRSAEIFDPAANAFQPAAAMAVPRVKHAAARLADGRVLIIGGSDRRGYRGRFTSTEIYDPAADAFSPGPDLHWGRHKIRDAVAVLPSGAVLVAGGATRAEIFEPGRKAFVPVEGELGGPQMFATATLLRDGEVLVLGGYDDRTQSSAAAWLVRLSKPAG